MRLAAAVLGMALCGSPSSAATQFYTFAEWERLPDAQKIGYVSGSIDAMMYFVNLNNEIDAWLYNGRAHCMSRSKITNGQMTQGVTDLVRTRPELRSGTVSAAIVEYFGVLCPDLFGEKAMDQMLKGLIAPPAK